ncbi:NAD(P)H-hydrate dehydratase [Desulfobulbus propionicus]
MLGIVGTIPDARFPLLHGRAHLVDDQLWLADQRIPVHRGTPALLAAAVKASQYLHGPEIYAFLAGDIGMGQGSRDIYAFLSRHVQTFSLRVLTFHYLQPDVDWHNKVLFAIEAMAERPMLIADAGFMYAAKMSGQAASYDFFTPDAGELAFLADEMAPHPFYTRGFILHQHAKVEELIHHAYQHDNAATHLLVKGGTDYVVRNDQIVAKVSSPSFPAMEAIGGTGDTLTGLLTSLCGSGFEPLEAAVAAASANRLCGALAHPTPATQIAELIAVIPQALEKVLQAKPV